VAEALPLFPLNAVLFPNMLLPLHIFEERYRTMVRLRIDADPMFGVVLTRKGREVGDEPEIHLVGTAASLLEAVRHDDGRYHLAMRGGRRFRVLDGDWGKSYLTGVVEWIDPEKPSSEESEAVKRHGESVAQAFNDYLDVLEQATGTRIERPEPSGDAVAAGYAICSMMPFDVTQRQRLLEIVEPEARLRELEEILRRERLLLLRAGIGGAAIEHPATRFSAN
jgi:Lon protease-like protein